MNTRASTRPRCLLTVSLLAVAILFVCGADAGERKHCLRAMIDESFMLPDGSVFPPGELKLCLTHHMSPVSGAHQTHVDGHPVGYFRSVKSHVALASQTGPSGPYFEFARNRHGELELLSYAWSDGTTTVVYDLTKLNKRKIKYRVTTHQQMRSAQNDAASEEEKEIVRLTVARQ